MVNMDRLDPRLPAEAPFLTRALADEGSGFALPGPHHIPFAAALEPKHECMVSLHRLQERITHLTMTRGATANPPSPPAPSPPAPAELPNCAQPPAAEPPAELLSELPGELSLMMCEMETVVRVVQVECLFRMLDADADGALRPDELAPIEPWLGPSAIAELAGDRVRSDRFVAALMGRISGLSNEEAKRALREQMDRAGAARRELIEGLMEAEQRCAELADSKCVEAEAVQQENCRLKRRQDQADATQARISQLEKELGVAQQALARRGGEMAKLEAEVKALRAEREGCAMVSESEMRRKADEWEKLLQVLGDKDKECGQLRAELAESELQLTEASNRLQASRERELQLNRQLSEDAAEYDQVCGELDLLRQSHRAKRSELEAQRQQLHVSGNT